jgi:hypothetical protein
VASEKAEGGLAGRYANAAFELAQDQKAIDAVSADLAALRRALETSPDLLRLVRSPVFSAEVTGNGDLSLDPGEDGRPSPHRQIRAAAGAKAPPVCPQPDHRRL